MSTFFCSQCGHATSQAQETEADLFCAQCGARMEREDYRQENVQQQVAASPPLTVEAAAILDDSERYPIKFNTVSGGISQNIGTQDIVFRPGDRVRYEGQSMDKSGLKAGMEGEVVRCFQSGADVYFSDLGRVAHLMDFHMRTCLKRMPPNAIAPKQEKRGETRRIKKSFSLIVSVMLILAAIIFFFIKFKHPEMLQLKHFLRYF